MRFAIEFFRGDERGVVFGMISTSQFISLILGPLSLFMLWYLGRPDARSERRIPKTPLRVAMPNN